MNVPEYDLTGTVAFVTGAGRGIGKGIAQVLAEAGASVIVNALTARYVEALAADIRSATGRRVMPLVADMTKSDEVERAVNHILDEFGALHILVNNLGDAIRKPLVAIPGQETASSTPPTDEELRLIMGTRRECSRPARRSRSVEREGFVKWGSLPSTWPHRPLIT